MSVSTLSASNQNYLKAIWSLQEWSDAPVTPSTLAAKAGVKLSSASDAVRRLADLGLIDHARYGSISLTGEGRELALAMVRRHRLIETFLVQVLGYRWDQVHDEAEALEHAVSDFLVDRIDVHLGHPSRDPHGDPIPAADGTLELPDAVLLSTLTAGSRARIERISDEDPALLQFFADHGIGIGTEIELRAGAPFSGAVEVAIAGAAESFPLGQVALDSVWATVLID
ncbi:transcriptional regulator [Leucobacter sp. OLJS4]|uniref:metal-dependent transcriptional regulator n=1 Tax=unclassified Leucobacter TaxID=2621730 RepID=UPI000C184662|nr:MULTISPECIES: metal-dependent transcriptional regulator [unclassified Leucobacter]PII85554.1 transcriptional regulator [Leucobacter sp. OLCALW19]PII91704.1 transcriptional regulator [Leucobacter sp. OLAS13]PII94707.1 transcriptional regulator [Leucobacter sp. OLTLW20]PII96603.1 transcriptional regulator [Leucobacter sp. OLDS2]PII99958.1 transcriptional regulator [Leucobacter sp. OLCS4]